MAQFGVERLVTAKLVLNLAAVTRSFVNGLEAVVVLVDAVRRTSLPLVLPSAGLALLVGRRVLLSAALVVRGLHVLVRSGAFFRHEAADCVFAVVTEGES